MSNVIKTSLHKEQASYHKNLFAVAGFFTHVKSGCSLDICNCIICGKSAQGSEPLFYFLSKGTNYLNIKKIFKDYISIFSNARKHLWLFWGVPVLLSAALVQVTALTSELAEHLSVFLSILISAFFAMLSILVSKDTSKQTGKLYEQVLKETASTVLLEIVLCMMALIISLAIIFLSDSIKYGVQIIISIFEYYLVFVMVLNMLILIKRFKALIDNG